MKTKGKTKGRGDKSRSENLRVMLQPAPVATVADGYQSEPATPVEDDDLVDNEAVVVEEMPHNELPTTLMGVPVAPLKSKSVGLDSVTGADFGLVAVMPDPAAILASQIDREVAEIAGEVEDDYDDYEPAEQPLVVPPPAEPFTVVVGAPSPQRRSVLALLWNAIRVGCFYLFVWPCKLFLYSRPIRQGRATGKAACRAVDANWLWCVASVPRWFMFSLAIAAGFLEGWVVLTAGAVAWLLTVCILGIRRRMSRTK